MTFYQANHSTKTALSLRVLSSVFNAKKGIPLLFVVLFSLFFPGAVQAAEYLGGNVWIDSNANGIQDAGEVAVSGITVTIIGVSITYNATTTTASDGSWISADLRQNKTYSATFSGLSSGYLFSPQDQGTNDNIDSDANPSTGATIAYTTTRNTTITHVDAGIYLPVEIDIQGNSNSIPNGDATPTTTDDTDFDSLSYTSGTSSHTFTIFNDGDPNLVLSGSPAVAISGTHASDFTVTSQPSSPVAGGGISTFVIEFDPSAIGSRSALVTIDNNDSNENPYTFSIQGEGVPPPEMSLIGNGNTIYSNDSTPSVSDNSYFGSADIVTGSVNHTFTISNTGGGNLYLGTVLISGDAVSDFTVTTQPSATIGISSSDDFVIQFDPSIAGNRNAVVSIDNNDDDENPYTFAIQGTGSVTPEMDVSGNSVSIADGTTSTSLVNHSDFGDTDVNNGGFTVSTFTIANSGSGDLTLTGPPYVTVFGTQASDFTVSQQPASATVAAQGGTQTFQITFDPPTTGLRQASVSITNDDADESPYTFAIRGTGTINPEIDIQGSGRSIANGASSPSTSDSTEFGSALVGGTTHIVTYTIENTGPAPLNLTDSWPLVAISGTHAGDFSLASAPSTPIASSGSTSFQVAFDPLTSGTRSATLTILNDDLDEGIYAFAIQGTGISSGASLNEIDVQGNLISISNGDSNPENSDGTDFGSTSITSGTLSQTFMISNTGTEDLILTSLPLVTLSGPNASDFSITLQPSSPVAPSGSVPFNFSFNPSAAGLRTAVVNIENNDGDENPYTFDIVGFGLSYPEIEVRGNNQIIYSGDTTPSLSDSTDFGDVHPVLVKAYATYTIYNTGDSTLDLSSGVALGGDATGEFTVTSMPSSSIPAGGSSDFTIEFDPAQTGVRNVSVSIANNDINEDPYTFWLTGYGKTEGTPFPCISRFFHIWGNEGDIAAMDATVNPYVYNIATSATYSINGVGYNLEDGMLYAFEQDGDVPGDNIVRIDGNYNIEVLSVTIPFLSWRADFDVLGNMYFWDASGGTIGIFDASTGIITTQTTSGATWLPIDMAYLDADGNFYGIQNADLYQYNPNTNAVTVTPITGRLSDDFINNINSAYYGAAWTASDGYLFTTNSQSGKMYKIDPSGLSIYVGQGEADLNKSDGASCPLVPAPLPSTGSIGDFVWVDSDADGIQDANEPGAPGITIDLYGIDNSLIASTVTDQNGAYSFTSLEPSEYYLHFTNAPAGCTLTLQNQGGDDVNDSDPDPTTGKTANFFVGVGLIEEGQDAGYKSTGVGDFIWDDLNNNGDQDYGEPGVPGVTVQLVDAANTSNVIDATTSDAYGKYCFKFVSPANYRIIVSNLPGGYQFVSQNSGANDDVDSDVNATTGISDQFTVSTNTFNTSIDAGMTQTATPDISVSGNSTEIVDGDTSPSTSDSTDFGSVSAASGDVTVTFTVANTSGAAVLTLNGSPIVEISGTHASDFIVTSAPATTISSGSPTTFTITFDPSDNGLRSAIVSISSNDPGENPYDFDIQGTGIAPEIAIQGNGQNIVSGDNTPSASDDTDFGSYDIDTGTNSTVFTIQNTGAATLNLTGGPLVIIGGTNPGDFSITSAPATPVASSGSTTFTVQFDPTAVGLRVATISISNSDPDENPFTFDVQGTGTSVPEIVLQGNLNNIADGNDSPSTSDLTDFGNRDIFAAPLAHSFTIWNVGSGALSLTGLPIVQISGANAGDFVVSQQPGSSTVTPAGSVTFQVSFDPTTTGVRQAIVLIASDDTDESPFSFAVQGVGTSTLDEEIEVLGNNLVIESGDIFPMSGDFTDMGTAEISGVPATATFVIRNIGYAALSLTGPPPYVDFSGTNASEFTITSIPSNSIAIDSATTSFEVTFTPFALGIRTATLTIQNNDADENPYTFTIEGTGIYDPTSQSEMSVKGNMQVISDGDPSPSSADGTDFGNVEVIGGLTATQEFVVYNTGSDDLVLGHNPTILITSDPLATPLEDHPGDFTVIANPATLVAPYSSVAFTVEFNPFGTGARKAIVSIGNSDQTAGRDPYTFAIQGIGVTTPEMSVSGNGVTITNGDASPGVSDSTNFGDVDITTGLQFVTYTINNSGNTDLRVTIDSISFSGVHAADFSVTSAPVSSIATGNSAPFVIQFDPSSIGVRTATISIANNDPDENPYVFDIQGNGTSPSDGVIGNMVWLDNDGDGVQDAGEDAMAGITVSLFDSGDNSIGSVLSGSDGSYAFEGLASGDYYLTFTNPPTGFSLTQMDQGGDNALDSDADPANSGKTATFSLGISATDNTRDAGFIATGIGDFVWLDSDEDGLQDVGESGVPGIDVEIKIDGGASVATTTTDAAGYFSFTGLTPQTYRLYFTGLAAGYVFTTQDAGADDFIDSDINSSTGESDALVISSNIFTSSIDVGVYQQAEPEISIRGNGVLIVDGDNTPSASDFTDFGSTDAQVDSVIHSFKIYNGNGATLTLNGTPKVSLSGTNASDFYVLTEPSETVPSNDSTSFEICFIPDTEGLKAATVTIYNTDSDENPFTFDIRGNGLASEIEVKGNDNVIVTGDNTPAATDFTDFGSEDILTGSQAQIFSILNTGNADLVLSNPSTYVSITGDNAADFAVTSVPATPIATNNSTSFTITFDPNGDGLRQAIVSIANNDLDEDPYSFTIQGLGLATPEISVFGNGESIADGDNAPISTDNTDFDSKDILAATQENTFYLKNTGSGVLTLSGTPLVVLSGTHAGDFLVSSQPAASSVAPGDSVAFTITFNPTAVGLRTASLSIANDDDDENPFDFSIQGTGIASPELNILGNGVSIANEDVAPSVADSTIFEDTILDSSSWVSYTIENTGSAVLTLTGGSPYIFVSGAHASDFTLTLVPQATISAGGGTTDFTIKFTPSGEGVRTATISIASDDEDDNPYTFSISGTALPMPEPLLEMILYVNGEEGTVSAPGDTLTYTVYYWNSGVGIAKSVVIDEAIPVQTTYVENSAAGTGMTITFQHETVNEYNSSQTAPVTGIRYELTTDLASDPDGNDQKTLSFRVVVD